MERSETSFLGRHKWRPYIYSALAALMAAVVVDRVYTVSTPPDIFPVTTSPHQHDPERELPQGTLICSLFGKPRPNDAKVFATRELLDYYSEHRQEQSWEMHRVNGACDGPMPKAKEIVYSLKREGRQTLVELLVIQPDGTTGKVTFTPEGEIVKE